MSIQENLFQEQNLSSPLAYRVRPINYEHYFGQKEVLEKIKNLKSDQIRHFIFYGPPGSGKTTLAFLISQQLNLEIVSFNAVMAGVPELRKRIKEIIERRNLQGIQSILFIDEIHRFNKSQQDALLPHLEKGDFILLGATTEYPQTSLNRAILSRVNTLELKALNDEDIQKVLKRALETEKQELEETYIQKISLYSNGDARFALNKLEEFLDEKIKTSDSLERILKRDARAYDKNSHRHYDVISAFIKSIRGSDVDAAFLWLAVMIDGGESPDFIARRLMILASEDIGNADPRALQIATSAHYAVKTIGMPEARIILAQACAYLSRAPKSNSVYLAIDKALKYVRENPTQEVPTHLRNHHSDKKNYQYPHGFSDHYVEQVYKLNDEVFFESGHLGYEKLQSDFEKRIK